MNGAQSLLSTMVANGVTTCFMNPGTSEMHFVAALDDVPDVRGVLCLFEGVASGAADGYGRVTERRLRRCSTSAPGSAMRSRTCTTPAVRTLPSSTSSATMPRTTRGSTPPSTLGHRLDRRGTRRLVPPDRARRTTSRGDAAAAIPASYGPPGPRRHARPAGRLFVVAAERACPRTGRPSTPPRRRRRRGRRGRRGSLRTSAHHAPARWRRDAPTRPARGRSDRGRRPGSPRARDVPVDHGSRGGRAGVRPPQLPR